MIYYISIALISAGVSSAVAPWLSSVVKKQLAKARRPTAPPPYITNDITSDHII